ncbi:MAG: DUF3592 domain-containing protein [Candidatus Obscuribacterales bacterium]|nr:DUF3592 domain-containing protein [Candidatus Obscuribacterales bacterium]
MGRKGSPIISTIILMVIGLMLCGVGFYTSMHQKDIKEHGVEATATIVNKDQRIERHTDYDTHNGHRYRHEKQETKYFYQLEFSDKGGVKHIAKHDLSYDNWKKHEKGETVEIKFLENNPDDLRLLKEVEGDPMIAFYVCAGIGGLLIVGGVGYLGWSFFSGRIA